MLDSILKRISNKVLDRVEEHVSREISNKLAPKASQVVGDMIEAITDDTPDIRSTGGSTNILLPRIQNDFKDFHAEDADTDIQTFLIELLKIKVGMIENFQKAKVSNKVVINTASKTKGDINDIKVNKMAIGDYQKSLNSATIKYRTSVGYQLNGGRREEKLFEVEYTLQLRDEYGALAFLECQNCGAPLKESDEICPYCRMKHMRDTISNWVVTDYKEI